MALSAALIGQHLIQPFLSMTYYDALPYEKLIPASQQLCTDLLETAPQDLLNLDKPAFKFTSDERFKSCMWKDEILSNLKTAAMNNRDEVVKVISLCLPKLAGGWFRKRGDVFVLGILTEKVTNYLQISIGSNLSMLE